MKRSKFAWAIVSALAFDMKRLTEIAAWETFIKNDDSKVCGTDI